MEISEAAKVLSSFQYGRVVRGAPKTSELNEALTMGIRALSFLDEITKPGDRIAAPELDAAVALMLAVEEIEKVIARVKRAEALASRKAPTEWATAEEARERFLTFHPAADNGL